MAHVARDGHLHGGSVMTGTHAHRRLSLRANFSWTFFANVFKAACWLAMTIVLAQLGSPSDVGTFALGLAMTAPVFMFATLRLRDVQATDTNQTFQFADYFALRIITTVLAMTTVSVIVMVAGYQAEAALVILATGVSKSVEAISECFYGMFMQYERLDRVAKSKLLKGPLELIGLSIGFAMTQSVYWGVIGIVAARLGVLLVYEVPLAISTVKHWASQSQSGSLDSFWPRWKAPVLKDLMWLALPLGFVQMLTALNINIPRYFIESELGPHFLGIFAAVAAFQKVAPTVVQALGHSASPRLAKYYVEGNAKAYRKLTLRLTGFAVLLGMGGILVAAVLGRQLLTLLYGPEYALPGLFVLVMAGAGAHYLATMWLYAITSARRFKIQLPLHILSTIAVAATCFWLIPTMGLNGAAISLIVGNLVRAIGCLVVVIGVQRSFDGAGSLRSTSTPPLQVELVGCTGAGKSTIAEQFVRTANARGTALQTADAAALHPLRLSWMDRVRFGRHIRNAAIHLSAVVGSLFGCRGNIQAAVFAWRQLNSTSIPRWRKYNQLRKVLKQLGRFRWIQRRSMTGFVLVDEGTVHAAHNLFVHRGHAVDRRQVFQFADEVPLPDLLIYLREDESTLIERTMRRGHPRVDCTDPAAVKDFVRNAMETFELLTAHDRIKPHTIVLQDGQVRQAPSDWLSPKWNDLRTTIDFALRWHSAKEVSVHPLVPDDTSRFEDTQCLEDPKGILPC